MWVVLVCGDANFTNFCTEDGLFLFPFPKNCWNRLESLLEVRLFSRRMTALATLANMPFLKKQKISCDWTCHIPYWRGGQKLHSTWLFCWGVPGAVYSNLIPIPSYLQACSKSTFSLALLNCAYLTCTPHLVYQFLIRSTSHFSIQTFLL